MPGSNCLPIYIDSSITGYKQASLPNPCVMEAAAAPLLLGILLLSLSPSPLTAQSNSAKPGCRNTCGNLIIPYPFRIGSGCYLAAEGSNMFPIDCDSEANPPMAYLQNRSTLLHITDFSVADHELKLKVGVASDCYDASNSTGTWLKLSRFPISRTKNMFTATGCDTVAGFFGTANTFNKTCMARCDNTMANTTWSGFGYCQMSVPWDCKGYSISIFITNSNSDFLGINSCSYGFVAEKGYIEPSKYLLMNLTRATVPVVVEWSIPGEECDEAQQNNATFACKENTNCTDVMSGYQCQCKEGYQGNPYLSDENGCQDIDECQTSNPCNVTSMCINLPGSVNCSCPKGYLGNGLKNGTGCRRIIQSKKYISRETALAIGGSVMGMLLLYCITRYTCKLMKRRREAKLKARFFKKINLAWQLSPTESSMEKGKLFNPKELDKATDHFHEDRILGKGGQGTVYKGMLTDGTIVAIKKSIAIDEENVESIINELVILSQTNHRNIVKLFGCCLEGDVPLLVYEFIPNGTLYDYIHDQEHSISWERRLNISIEVASALFYLHSSSCIPIYHRDIKSSNILLDEKYRAKIGDFGTSRSISIDQTHLTTLVQGTFGYLDPEYLQTSQYTDKSDVYSFGVVLVELLTGQKPVSLSRATEGRNLAAYFIMCMEENRLFDIIDAAVMEQGSVEEITAVAKLAKRCLDMRGRKRPSMREVAMELEGIRKSVLSATLQEEITGDHVKAEMFAEIDEMFAPREEEMESDMTSISDVHPFLSRNTR